MEEEILQELVRTSSLLSRETTFKGLASVLVEQSQDVTRSSLAALYLFPDPENPEQPEKPLHRFYQRGRYTPPPALETGSELIQFLLECPESIVLSRRTPPAYPSGSPFTDLFLDESMNSGIALPLFTPSTRIGVLILNSRKEDFYSQRRFSFLNSLTQLSAGILQNSQLLKELREYVKQVEELERYQESIFASMTNLLITTDDKGRLAYFNPRAAEGFGLTEDHKNRKLSRIFTKPLGKKTLDLIEKARTQGKEMAGIEGIYKPEDGSQEMDYALNIAPLLGKRGRREGTTLLFTDQTRQRQLQQQMDSAVEDRRVIKNMFSRYLSKEVVHSLMESPEQVKPGGDEKQATVFFADIRGYTSFSEGKDPKYIIEILNEYFSEAVELVVKYGGYIDKFIGDCIMAAWGVPIVNEQEDAIQAVSCAVEIQEKMASAGRHFFTGDAKDLRVGIGMHTGPLVAGNLGSSRRMDYSVIGDTVNVAARLEGVAGPDEIIITEHTRHYLKDQFDLEERSSVTVKGKKKPIPIYNVKGRK